MNNKHTKIAATLALLLGTFGAMGAQAANIVPEKSQLQRLCKDCSFVSNVHTETRQGKSSGVGVVGGAVVGGLLGNQVGGGTGKALMTLGGAAAGGYAGNQIEKNSNKHTVWVVRLVHKDGRAQTREFSNDPQLRAGDTVASRDGRLMRQ